MFSFEDSAVLVMSAVIVVCAVLVVFWALLISLAVWVRRHSRTHHDDRGSWPGSPTPDQLLAGRVARGEIDQQQYAAGQAALRDHVR
jgi:putative membrane protein